MLIVGPAVLYIGGLKMMKKNFEEEKKRYKWYFIIGGVISSCITLYIQRESLRSQTQNSGDFFFNRS